MNYTYVPLPLVEEAQSVSASAQVLVIDDGEVKRTDATNIGIKPTGKLTLTNTTETDCTNYAAVQIVDANLLAENIKKDVTILGTTGSYEGGGSSDFSTAEVQVTLGAGVTGVFFTGAMTRTVEGQTGAVAYTALESSGTISVILYGENATVLSVEAEPATVTVVTTGDINNYYSEDYEIEVFGSGTITVTAGS